MQPLGVKFISLTFIYVVTPRSKNMIRPLLIHFNAPPGPPETLNLLFCRPKGPIVNVTFGRDSSLVPIMKSTFLKPCHGFGLVSEAMNDMQAPFSMGGAWNIWNPPENTPTYPNQSSLATSAPEFMPNEPLGASEIEPLFDFDDLLASKIVTTEDMVNPLIESDQGLNMAMYGLSHPLDWGTAPTSSISDMSLLGLPPLPSAEPSSYMNGLGRDSNYVLDSISMTRPSYETLACVPGRTGTDQVMESQPYNKMPSAKPLSGNYTADTFASMTSPEHDLYGFLSKAGPLTQMASTDTEAHAQSYIQPLSTMPCLLPISSNFTTNMGPVNQTVEVQSSIQPLFSTAQKMHPVEPLMAVVEPVITKETAEQTSLASVSLAAATGNSSVNQHTISSKRPSAATLSELGILAPKKNTAQRLYECPTCFKVFDRAYNRKMHMATHEAIEKRFKPFKCPLKECGKQFSRKHDMNRHYLGVHLRARKSSSSGTPRKAQHSTISTSLSNVPNTNTIAN